MIRKSTILKSLTALVMSALSTTAVQAEVLVPVDQFLANTTRHYEANQYKTSYTVYVPQTELQGNAIVLNPAAVGEPVKLPTTSKNGITYVDIESDPAMLGVSYTKVNGQLTLGPAPQASTVKAPYTMQTPLSWAFDPWPTQGTPYQAKLNSSGDNIISPSWFKLHSLGLEASPNVSIDYVNDYKINLYQIAYLSDDQIQKFKSDFRIVAEFFSQKQKHKDFIPSHQQIKHVKEVLQLLSIMTDDHRFEDIYNEELKNDKGGLKTMCDVLDRIEEKGIKTGEVTMAYVALKLVNAGRGNDLERAVRDDDFRNKLIEEFGEKI